MSPDRLLDHFDRISEAPDAIARLRRFILDLAVRGKLVEQNPNDEPAPELLKRIRAEKARVMKEGGIKKEKALPPLIQEALPFRLPANWCWSQLAEIGYLNPRNTAADKLLASFVPMPLIPAEYGAASKHEVRPWEEIKSGYTHFAEGDVALAKITPCFENGKSTIFRGLTGGIGAGTTELHVVRPVIVFVEYILIFLKCPFFIESGIPRMTGTAGQKRVPTEYFAYSPFPVPPLAEQHRIVAKVDELMALCDRLEAAQTERESRRDRLVAASLHRLNNGADADEFHEHARFHLRHLPRLATRVEHIQQLRQTILNLAVRGKLVPQDSKDEPASELLKRIQAWRSAAITEGKIRMPRKQILAVDDSEAPYELRKLWDWVRLGQIIYIHSGDGLTSEAMRRGSVPVFGGNGITGFHDTPNVLRPTVVIGRVGYYCGSIHVTPSQAWITDNAFITEFCTDAIFQNFLVLLLKATNLKENEKATAQPVISGAKIYPIIVGLPPLAEQHRIVAKVDELLAQCDRLEAQLTATQTESRRLLEAVLHEALNGNL